MKQIAENDKFRKALKLTTLELYQSSFPKYVMLKKGLGLPDKGKVHGI